MPLILPTTFNILKLTHDFNSEQCLNESICFNTINIHPAPFFFVLIFLKTSRQSHPHRPVNPQPTSRSIKTLLPKLSTPVGLFHLCINQIDLKIFPCSRPAQPPPPPCKGAGISAGWLSTVHTVLTPNTPLSHLRLDKTSAMLHRFWGP